ncbi:secreted protein, partial [Candidatus Thiomargarita nelsonii]
MMKKRIKLKTALLLAAATNMTYASESCFPPKSGQTPLDVLECFQKQIQALQTENQQLRQDNTALTERVTKLEDSVTGSNRLLTFSSFVELDKKAVIKPGEEWTAPTGYSTFRRGQFRIALWVNVAGHVDKTQSTTVNVYHYGPGYPLEVKWQKDPQIANWKISGRNWGDHYVDLNIS